MGVNGSGGPNHSPRTSITNVLYYKPLPQSILVQCYPNYYKLSPKLKKQDPSVGNWELE